MGDGRTPSYLESRQSEFSKLPSSCANGDATLSCAPSHTGSQVKPVAWWEYVPHGGESMPPNKRAFLMGEDCTLTRPVGRVTKDRLTRGLEIQEPFR